MEDKLGSKIYLLENVYDAAVNRINTILDSFENIVVSVSGGKDSTALFSLVSKEAQKRGRKVNAFFIDQEAEYAATIDVIDRIMRSENTIPHWYQVPIRMTNATSYVHAFLNAWGEGEKWMREKSDISIHHIDEKYPDRFYPFIEYFERKWDLDNTVFFVGLRAEESLNRFRAVIKNPGWNDLKWTSKSKGEPLKAYPLYDWTFEDVWHYIAENNVHYNKIYDYQHIQGMQIDGVRVSNLIHEKSYKCLTMLQEFEPKTYDKLVERIEGIAGAARYANEDMVYSTQKLPDRFLTWKEYRDFLLHTTPTQFYDRFVKRFSNQPEEEYIYRQQCKQLLLNDGENNLNVTKQNKKEVQKKIDYWKKVL